MFKKKKYYAIKVGKGVINKILNKAKYKLEEFVFI